MNVYLFHLRLAIQFKQYDIYHNESQVKLQIYDNCIRRGIVPDLLAEKEDYFAKICFMDANAILLCYSPENISSFQSLNEWISLIGKHATQDVVLYIVALKADILPSLFHNQNPQSYVHPKEGEKYAYSRRLPFYQVSSLNSEGIDELFSSLLKDIEEPSKFFEKKIQTEKINEQKLINFSHNDEANYKYGIEVLDRIVPDMVNSVIGSSYVISSAKNNAFSSSSIDYPNLYNSGTLDPGFLERTRSQFSNKKKSIGGSGKKISFVKNDIRDLKDDDIEILFE